MAQETETKKNEEPKTEEAKKPEKKVAVHVHVCPHYAGARPCL